MEKILVPTDLAEKSELSLLYAIDFGAADQAQIILFNNAIKEEDVAPSQQGLQQALDKIKSTHQQAGAVSIETESATGPVLQGIAKKLVENTYSLICMVTHGEDHLDFNIGSISTKVAQKGKAPALLVPENNEYQKVDNVLIVNDFTDSRADEPAFKHLDTISKKSGLKSFLLHATAEYSKIKTNDKPAEVMGAVKVEQSEKISFATYHDLIAQVKDRVEQLNIQMIYLPSSQVIFEKIFVGNFSRQLALATKLPVYIYF